MDEGEGGPPNAAHTPCGSSWLHVCQWCGAGVLQGHFMFVTNLEECGHLVNPEGFTTEHLNNDMYEIFNNRKVSRESGAWH